ncbi:hypothetical protein [Paenibacillus larvae]|uniref:Uncharacterized protein n=1 Tax=Paenibacillus larvae subsp. larvae DSM 25430 TaxID=697284 RepID=V9W998_9BACL|nr:hypothetical protein [Paenibacillus larvae]AHD06469.1 hypothetical protein ERIC2_c26820 [Paenibacillus larvae subsp. larvae DSM 25430]AVG13015.1 hypothetical protein ERICII_02661 [Paenibacillus larvae subsp. larvae DSM 25430]MDR5568990.1 hypothetical protein [Paenibacillus larvae]MDR5596735.1 hypothetical protein [Paenibacillus larvae]
MGVLLEKFPIIAPDGEEYRITVYEEIATVWTATLYKERKWKLFGMFRFKKIYEVCFEDYNPTDDKRVDFVAAARYVWREYKKEVNARIKSEQLRLDAVKHFEEWDGKL